MMPSFNLGYFHTQKSRNKYNEILTTVKFKWCAYMWLFATLFSTVLQIWNLFIAKNNLQLTSFSGDQG